MHTRANPPAPEASAGTAGVTRQAAQMTCPRHESVTTAPRTLPRLARLTLRQREDAEARLAVQSREHPVQLGFT